MNKVFEYYTMLMTRWIPSRPMDAIMPFFLTLLYEEKIESVDSREELLIKFKDKFGFDINYFLVHNLLIKFCKDGLCKRDNDKYKFDYQNIDKKFIIDSKITDNTHDDIEYLLSDFIKYCGDEEFNKNTAEKTLKEFLKNYDIEFIHSFESINSEVTDVYMYFFIEYVKNIYEKNAKAYSILVKICEGNMIKSILLNENVSTVDLYEGQLIFLDTPIVLKILGYYGEFIQKEYQYLVECWINQGVEIYVYQHSKVEIENVLNVAARWVEALNVDNSKTSETTKYFRKKGFTKEDVINELGNLEDNLSKNNILIYERIESREDFFTENEDEIRSIIVKIYNKSNPRYYYDSLQSAEYIDYDVKSIVDTYIIRGKKKVQKYSESKAFFVTNNLGIIQAINEYNNKHYPNTLMPVIKDTYIGMIVAANSQTQIDGFVEKNLIAFCYGAYKPTKDQLSKYTLKLDELRGKNEINEKQYFILKNHADIDELIAQKTLGYSEEITDHTIFEIYDELKSSVTKEIVEEKDREIKQIQLKHEEQIKDIEKTNTELLNAEINAKDQEIKQKDKDIYSLCIDEYNEYKKKIRVGFIIVAILLFLLTGIKFIFFDLKELNFWNIVSSVFLLLFPAIYSTFTFIKEDKIFRKLVKRKKKNLINKYNLSDEYLKKFNNFE